MSLTGSNFNEGAAPAKKLTEFDDNDVEAAIAANRLFSEELERAGRDIQRLGNDDITESFQDVVRQLLSGEYQSGGGSGFAIRDSLGHALNDMLSSEPDMGRFSRLVADTDGKIGGDKALLSGIKALKAELKAHHAENGVKPFDGFDAKSGNLQLKAEM